MVNTLAPPVQPDRSNTCRRLRKVQMRGGARRQQVRRTPCTLNLLPRAPTKQLGLSQPPALGLVVEMTCYRHPGRRLQLGLLLGAAGHDLGTARVEAAA